MIEIYLLEQLVAVAEHDTLSKAAESLHLTQPALTRSMKKLENQLGISLFQRSRNKITLNETGVLAASHAKQIIHAENEMIHELTAAERKKHTISLGSCAPLPLSVLQSRLIRLYSMQTITTEMTSEDKLLQGLDDDTYQLIVLSHPFERQGFQSAYLFKEHLFLSVMPAHPVADMSAVTFRDIDGETFIIDAAIGIWREVCRNKLPHSHFIEQANHEDLFTLRRNSSLPAFDTDLANQYYGSQKPRISIPINDDCASINFYLVCKNANADILKSLSQFH